MYIISAAESHKVVARAAASEPSFSVLIITYANYFLIFFFSIIALLFIGEAAAFISLPLCVLRKKYVTTSHQTPQTASCPSFSLLGTEEIMS